MKKAILMLVATTLAFIGCVSNNTHKNSTTTVDLISKLNSFEIAKTTESYMTDSLAQLFPETLMFLGHTENKVGYMLLMNTLPTTYSIYQSKPDMSKYFSWVNITLVKNEGHTLGLLPRHAFVNDGEITDAMKQYGMNFAEKKDLICINLKKIDQALSVLPADELNGEKINGSLSCAVLKRIPLKCSSWATCMLRMLGIIDNLRMY